MGITEMNVAVNKRKRVLFLLLWSVALRAIVLLLLPPAKEFGQYEPVSHLFFSALTDHFPDYISHITLIPPASYIINAFVFMLLGVKEALHIRAFIITVSVMDIAAVLLLFDAAKKAGAGARFSLLLLSLFSAILIPFELWRDGMFYDQHTIFFVSFFAWALVGLISNAKSYACMAWVSLAGALLVSQSAVNSAIVPVSILLILAFIYIPVRQFRRSAIALVITLLLPLAVLVMISQKNKRVSGETLTSNKAGPAMMMVVQRSYNYDQNKVRSVAKEFGAPEYYLWTYDHASIATETKTGKPDTLFHILSQAFGICYYDERLVNNPGLFGFDFHPLLEHLRQNDSLSKFTRMVEADSIDVADKPYRMAGYSQALSPRWIGIYGDISKKIFFKNLLKNPAGMLKSFVIQQGIFSIYGPLFPFNTMRKETNLLIRAGLRTIPNKMPLDPLFVGFVIIFAIVAWITYGIALLNLPFTFIQWLRNRKTTVTSFAAKNFLLMSLPLVLVALVFSCLVGGENDRYFMQASPYIILLATLLPAVYKNFRKRNVPA